MLLKYTPSGAFTSRFFIGAPIVLLAAGVLGAVYQVLMHYIPLIYLDLLICCGMGVATGYTVALLSKNTHCRNRLAGTGLGLAAGLLALAVGHYVEYRLNRPGIVASAPAEMQAAIDANMNFRHYIEIRAEAWWTIGKVGRSGNNSPTISGGMSYVVWGIEAVIIAGFAAAGGYKAAAKPYCEKCGVWADHDMLKVAVANPTPEAVAAVKGAAVVGGLIPVQPAAPALPVEPPAKAKVITTSTLKYAVTSCPECKTFHTLQVDHEVVTTKGSKTESKNTTLHDKVLLTSEEVATFAQLRV